MPGSLKRDRNFVLPPKYVQFDSNFATKSLLKWNNGSLVEDGIFIHENFGPPYATVQKLLV